MKPLTYRAAGVDIDAGDDAVRRIATLARSTARPEVLAGVGGFAAFVSMPARYREPVMVASTDGVGTKLKVAFLADRHDTVGIDLVAMGVNDLLVHGAEPLYFLDYIGTARLDPARVETIVKGIVAGCRLAGCALVGDETAELPDLYAPGEYDLAGFAVGIVERSRIVDGSRVRPGDVAEAEMFRVFNMGIGYVIVLPPKDADLATGVLRDAGESVLRLGEVVAGERGVEVVA